MGNTRLYRFAKTFLPWLFRALMPFRVHDADFMPQTGAVILCCNHASNTDPIRLAYTQKRQIFYMAKEELFRSRFLAHILRALGAFPVARGKGDIGAVNLARRHLEEGDVLGLFLEGTRSKDGNLQKPKAGAVMLSSSCGVPILPCCITARGGGVPKMFRTVVIAYGRPIQPEELGISSGTPGEYRAASQMVMGKIAELREKSLKEFH